MNKCQICKISIILATLVFIISPTFVFAGPSAGIKPNSLFYFFDTTFEKVGLFFTFDSEKKAQKALEYADERLAEAQESANENKPEAVEKAMAGYKKEISFATEKSKEIKDEIKAEALLNTVSENTSKHQEVLESVLEKVPEEAKQAILNAIEVSKKGQEEAQKQISELEKEVVRLKQELKETKEKLEHKDEEVKKDIQPQKESEPISEKDGKILETFNQERDHRENLRKITMQQEEKAKEEMEYMKTQQEEAKIKSFISSSGSEFGSRMHDYFPIISSFFAEPSPNISIKIGDEIYLKVEVYEPKDRQILYSWWCSSCGLPIATDKIWTTNNEIRYTITSEDIQRNGENLRIGVYIKSEKEYTRIGRSSEYFPNSGYDDGIYIDYKILF